MKYILAIVFGIVFAHAVDYLSWEVRGSWFEECVKEGTPPNLVSACAEAKHPKASPILWIFEQNIFTVSKGDFEAVVNSWKTKQ